MASIVIALSGFLIARQLSSGHKPNGKLSIVIWEVGMDVTPPPPPRQTPDTSQKGIHLHG